MINKCSVSVSKSDDTDSQTSRKPIRICFIFASRGIGGAERSMLRLMQSTHSHQLDCTVIVSGFDNPYLRSAAITSGIPFYQLGHLSVVKLHSLLKEIQPDIVYMFGRIRTSLWAIVSKLAGVRCLIGAERNSSDHWIDWVGRKMDANLITAYIANSSLAANNMRNWINIPNDRIFVVYNGIEWSNSSITYNTDDVTGKPLIVCVANITRRKGQIVLLQAIQKLRSTHPDIHALLIGRDDTQGKFFTDANALGFADIYSWVGYVPDVRHYLSKADIFVLPSLRREGLSTAVLEAMYAQVPVITSRVGGMPELVCDGKTGILVSPGDSSALAEKIEFLIKNPTIRQEIVNQAGLQVSHHHSIQSMVNGHMEVFCKLIARCD